MNLIRVDLTTRRTTGRIRFAKKYVIKFILRLSGLARTATATRMLVLSSLKIFHYFKMRTTSVGYICLSLIRARLKCLWQAFAHIHTHIYTHSHART